MIFNPQNTVSKDFVYKNSFGYLVCNKYILLLTLVCNEHYIISRVLFLKIFLTLSLRSPLIIKDTLFITYVPKLN